MKILVAGTGSDFGLGRYEALLVRALEEIAAGAGTELTCLWQRAHPSYLHVSARHARNALREPRPARYKKNRVAKGAFALELLTRALALRADVVVFTHVNLAPVALPLPVLRPSARVVVCTHGEEIWRRLPWPRSVALRRATRVVANASYNAERLRAVQRIRPERIDVIHLALDPRGRTTPRETVDRIQARRDSSASRVWMQPRDTDTRGGCRHPGLARSKAPGATCELHSNWQGHRPGSPQAPRSGSRVLIPYGSLKRSPTRNCSANTRSATCSFCPRPVRDSASCSSRRCRSQSRLLRSPRVDLSTSLRMALPAGSLRAKIASQVPSWSCCLIALGQRKWARGAAPGCWTLSPSSSTWSAGARPCGSRSANRPDAEEAPAAGATCPAICGIAGLVDHADPNAQQSMLRVLAASMATVDRTKGSRFSRQGSSRRPACGLNRIADGRRLSPHGRLAPSAVSAPPRIENASWSSGFAQKNRRSTHTRCAVSCSARLQLVR